MQNPGKELVCIRRAKVQCSVARQSQGDYDTRLLHQGAEEH